MNDRSRKQNKEENNFISSVFVESQEKTRSKKISRSVGIFLITYSSFDSLAKNTKFRHIIVFCSFFDPKSLFMNLNRKKYHYLVLFLKNDADIKVDN